MIVAGFGCRTGVSADDVAAAFALALDRAGIAADAVAAFAAPATKAGEVALRIAADRQGLPLILVPEAALKDASDRTLTRSERVVALLGVPSAAETAALAAAGPTARLVVPRTSTGTVTCALAAPPDGPGGGPPASVPEAGR